MSARGTAPASRRSLARDTLRNVAIRVAVVVAAATVMSHWLVSRGLERQALEGLSGYVEQRQARESVPFELATDNLATFVRLYQTRLAAGDPAASAARFDAMWESRPDGLRRLRRALFDERSLTGIIGRQVILSDDLKHRLVVAVDLLSDLGPAWAASFPNLYVVTPEHAVVMFWPEQPWALGAADWEVTTKLGLVAPGDAVIVSSDVAPAAPPGTRWSELYYDYGVQDWLVSAVRPVNVGGRHLLSVGQDLLLSDLIERTLSSDLEGTQNMLFRADGRLIAHPDLMEAIQASGGMLDIAATGDEHLQRIQRLAVATASRPTLVDNEVDDDFVAVGRIDGPGWYLATVFPKAIIGRHALETAWVILLLGLIALVLELLILSSALRVGVTRPLRQLMEATGRVTAGRFDARLDIGRDDELGELAASFERMADEVRRREEALSSNALRLEEANASLARELEERTRTERELARHRELNALLNAIDYGILFLDADLRARAANRAYLRMWNVPEEFIAGNRHAREFVERFLDEGLYGPEPADREAFVEWRLGLMQDPPEAPIEIRASNGRVLRTQCIVLPDGGRMLTYFDLTGEKQAMEALQEAEERHRRLLEVAPFPLTVTRMGDRRVLYANPRIRETLGVPPTALVGALADDYYVDPEDRKRLVDSVLAHGRASDVEVELKTESGRRFWALLNASATTYAGEDALLVSFNDITVLKDRERELQEANRRATELLRDLNAILDTIEYGVLFLDRDFNIRLTNRAYREIMGIEEAFYATPRKLADDLRQRFANGLYEFAPDALAEYIAARHEAITRGDEPMRERLLGNGKVIQSEIVALPDGGRMLAYLDITGIRRAEEALERHRAAMEVALDGMAILGTDGRYTYMNAAHAKIFGYDNAADLVGRSWRDLYPEDELEWLDREIVPKLQAEGKWAGEAVGRRRDGALFPQEVSLTAIAPDSLICVVRDITERKTLEARTLQERDRAEEASRAKSEFLANMSHELRTPMNAIIGFTRIVMRRSQDVLAPQQYANLEKILVSAHHLLDLINSVLDLAKVEAGQVDVRLAAVSVDGIVEECLRTVEPIVRSPAVALVKRIEGVLPAIVTDGEKVHQILINLLSNAVKFTESGSITVTARAVAGGIEIAVADTGIGIPGDSLETIFEEFRQVYSGRNRPYGGTGLGLSISRHLAGLVGGRIVVDSTVGAGSTFTLILPSAPPADAIAGAAASTNALPPAPPEDVANARILLAVDDDPDVIVMITDAVHDSGYSVVGAASGEEAIRLACLLQPSVITLDILMPGLDGWMILDRLRSEPATRSIPVVLLSVVDERTRGYRLGAADYLVKPFTREDLVDTLSRVAPPGREVLVVDDDPAIGDQVRQWLEPEGYRVGVSEDGTTALARCAAAAPDVVLLDLVMPGLDGFDVLDALERERTEATPPVIVVTARDLSPAERERLLTRVAAIIDKTTLDRESLMREVRRALGGARSR